MTISTLEWTALEHEFYNRVQREEAGLDIKPYHPVEHITFDDGTGPVEVQEVMIRLKGQSSWIQTVLLDPKPKMQFVIAFNEIDKDRRFRGVRKVELDMPRSDWTFLRQRLALYTMRQIGQDAQCANSARLYINGQYYGLFTHLERLDKEFLQRVYGKENGADDGDLWKGGVMIRTNEDSYNHDRIHAFWNARSVDQVSALVDLDASVYEWATEAVLPHADGYYLGRPNFFLYDHPERGFLWLPSDLDTAFDYRPHDLDLAFAPCIGREYDIWMHYALTLGDSYWLSRYIDAIETARARYTPSTQVALVNQWANQIARAAQDDPRRNFTMDQHAWALNQLRDYLDLRASFVDDWLDCREDSVGYDADGDGAVFCFDCNDHDPAIHRDRVDICNSVDDDCDGFLDEGSSCASG